MTSFAVFQTLWTIGGKRAECKAANNAQSLQARIDDINTVKASTNQWAAKTQDQKDIFDYLLTEYADMVTEY